MKSLSYYWKRIRLRPVSVFLFHHVSDIFEPDTMWECDWIQTEAFKKKVLALKKKYIFVSLTEAYNHIAKDKFRLRNYAALTADDGWESLKNILPWLADQGIPVTLFLNPLYLDGEHYRMRETERFLTDNDINRICEEYPNVVIGMHGWEHTVMTEQDENEFRNNVRRSIHALKDYRSFIPFFAYPWGKYNETTNGVLKELGVVPVLMDGAKNYDDFSKVQRELLMPNS